MLRPKRMSRISVTGSKAVMDDVIETMHDLNLLHIEDYDGSWEGFSPGDPISGADEISSNLVTVRSLESILDIQPDDVGPTGSVDLSNTDERLEEVRTEVNRLDDRRSELQDVLRHIEERKEQMRVFADLGLNLDLLWGYESIDVVVGEGDPVAVREALEAEDAVEAFDVFTGEQTSILAAFARTAEDASIQDAMVGVPFSAYDVPHETGAPDDNVEELDHQEQVVGKQLETIENELEEVKLDSAAFLLALEEQLTIDVQKAEAPLRFATTERAFIVEGWIPTEKLDELDETLTTVVDDRIELDELERADYNEEGHATHTEETAEGETVATDGGHHREPPVVQDNPKQARPFEVLTATMNRPKYSEIDPTFVVFLTFPLAFGFMIGDIGYGILYLLMGYAIYKYVDSEALQALGIIAIWAGIFTIIFGWFYDDTFGVHMLDLEALAPIHGHLELLGVGLFTKGLQASEWALLWIVVCILFGVAHLTVGFIFGFINDLSHGIVDAVTENVSWMMVLIGFFIWLFSVHLAETKPGFVVAAEGEHSVLEHFFGFGGLPLEVGYAGLAIFAVGVVLAIIGEGPLALLETLTVALANTLSYLRMVAVLLAKGGMAFVVNLLVFGAYPTTRTDWTGAEMEYIIFHLPGTSVPDAEPVFQGLIWMDPVFITIPIAILVFVFGHILVLLLGITAAGIQMVRLEYVEFFGKFYEGGGETFEPFGHERTYTEET